jgi:hypothetical protein
MGPSWLTGELVFWLFGLGFCLVGFVWPFWTLRLLSYFQERAFPEEEVRRCRWLCFVGIIAEVVFILDELAGNP